MKIASRIIDLRVQCGLSRYTLSQLTGIAQTQLAEYESGKTTPTIPTLLKITNALGFTLSEFFNTDRSKMYLSNEEIVHLKNYRMLTHSQQVVVNQVISELNATPPTFKSI